MSKPNRHDNQRTDGWQSWGRPGAAPPQWIVRVNFSFLMGSVEGESMYMHSQEDVRVEARDADQAREFAEAMTRRQGAAVATAQWCARIEYERF